MYSAGTVFLQVVPSYRGFQESVRRQAKEAARAFKGEFEKETGHNIADAIDKSAPDARRAADKLGTDIGKRVGGKTGDAIQKRIGEALKNLPDIKVDADTKPAQRAIAAVRKELETLQKGHASMDLDTGAVLAQLKQVEGNLIEINRIASRGSDVDLDTAGAAASLAKLDVLAAEATRDRTLNVDVDVHDAERLRGLGDDADNTANSFRAFNGVILAAVGLGPLLIPILGGLVGALAAVGPMAIAAASGLGVMVLGLSGIPAAVGALNDVAKNGSKDALAAEKTMRSASNGIRDAQQALVRARQQAARGEADAARRVADARRSLADAERQASRAIKDALDSERDARQNLRDVTERVNRAIAASERQVADAQRNLARAREDAARRNADALETVARAESRVVEAQQNALQAQEDLTRARREAQDDLEDLAARAAGGALAEREAVLSLADAKKQYDRVMGREFKSARSVEEVTLAYEEAQLALENIRRENGRTAEELAAANAAGVEGSEKVQTAQERIAEARAAEAQAAKDLADARADAVRTELDGIQSVADATRDLSDARRDLRQEEKDGARDISDAQQAIRDAVANTRDVRTEAARNIADAERGITNAVREQREQAVDSAQAIASAQQGLADAQAGYADALEQTGAIGSASMQKLEQAMDALSPAGQRFARFIFGLKDEFMALRGVAEAGLLPGVQDFLEMVISRYGPGFTKWVGAMAKVAGDLFREFGKVITQNPMWQEFFAAFGKASPKLFRDFGEATINWLTVFVALLDAFLPLALKASDWLVKLSEKAADWATGLEDTQGFKDFMGWLERVLPEVGDFFAALVMAALNLGRAIAPYGEMLLKVFTGILNFIAGMPPGVLAAIVFGIIAITVALQAAYGVMTLMLVGFTAFEVTVGAFVAGGVLIVAALVAMYLKFEWFRNFVNLVFEGLKIAIKAWWDYATWVFGLMSDSLKWLYDHAIKPYTDDIARAWAALAAGIETAWNRWGKPTWDAIATAANWLWQNVLSPVFGFIGEGFRTMATVIKWVWDNIWFPVIDLITTIIWNLWKLELKIAFELIEAGFRALGTAIKWVWDNVLAPTFNFFANTLHGKDGLVWVFEQAVAGIKTIWDSLQDIAKAPIKFIVETVLNNGLIAGFNKIAGFFGTKEMGEIPLPKGWATGGYTGAGGRYEPAGIVHRDEYVISSPARRRFEQRAPGALDYLNRTGTLPGYATGGVVRPVNGPFGLPYGNTYSDGSYHSGQDFPVATGTRVVAAIMGVVKQVLHLADSYGNHVVMKHPGGSETLYAHLSKTLVNAGDILAAGSLLGLSGATGHVTGPHLHFEFRTPPGGYGNAVDPRGILGGAPIPEGEGGPHFPAWMSNPFGWLKGKVGDLIDKIPGGGRFRALVTEVPKALLGMAGEGIGNLAKGVLGKAGDVASGAWDFINGPFGGRGDDEHAGLYDNGGLLMPGLTHVLNASRKPEAVLTNAQWQNLQRMSESNGGGGLTTGDLYAVDPEALVAKIARKQKDAAAVNNLGSIASGAGL
jgi:murein DD-endopeptidase MepM/ murein hydrolase activator NlpD